MDIVVHFPSENEVLHSILLFLSKRPPAAIALAKHRPGSALSAHLFF